MFPRALDETSYLLQQAVMYVDDTGVWESRTWLDPAAGENWSDQEMLGTPDQFVQEWLYLDPDSGRLWHVMAWRDTADDSTWETFEDFGRLAIAAGPSGDALQEPPDRT
jgi:hypothetical protein